MQDPPWDISAEGRRLDINEYFLLESRTLGQPWKEGTAVHKD